MSKHKDTRPAVTSETPAPEPSGPAASTPGTPESVVDEVFDVVTAWAAQGLGAAKRGLEGSSRWLDARARRVGELSTKLSSTSRSGTTPADASGAAGSTRAPSV